MAGAAPLSERPDAGLVAALEAAHIHPLWDRYKRITPVQPNAPDIAFHWRWSEIEPFAKRALAEVAIEDVERRALIMCNAAFGGQTVTTSNLIAAFSVLKPGDRAVPHRHVAAAIRFALRQSPDRWISDADAGLLCHAHRWRDATQAGDQQRRLPGGRRRGKLDRRRSGNRVVEARCLHHPALDLGESPGDRRQRRSVHGHRSFRSRALGYAARGDAIVSASSASQGWMSNE